MERIDEASFVMNGGLSSRRIVEARYGGHFRTVVNDLHETDDLRVLDVNGQRVFSLFRLDELGEPFVYEPGTLKHKVYMD